MYRSAPASPTHGLQFTQPSLPRETSPTKTVSQSVSQQQSLPHTMNKSTSPAPFPPSFPPPSSASHHNMATAAKVPFQTMTAQRMSTALPVSVIKSSNDTTKPTDTSDMEKNGLSQSSGEESPVEGPQTGITPASDGRAVGSPFLKQQIPGSVNTGMLSLIFIYQNCLSAGLYCTCVSLYPRPS